MVKRSKKSKSKRVLLKDKHKVIRKVKEHHRKKAKEAKKAKKLGLNRRPKVEKDPGIPNDWPFKEQELKVLEARRARAIEELEAKKAARKERARKRKLGLVEDDEVSGKPDDEPKAKDNNRSTGVDNSGRAFYQELVKVIEASDVILEVLDARDPLGSRCADLEKMVMKAGSEKHLLLILNKIDLVPRESIEKWLKYLREDLPAIAFKCNTQEQRSNLKGKSSVKLSKQSNNVLQSSDCLGADTLLKLLKKYSKSHEIKMSITVGVIGLPNVGKSSLINSLKRSHAVNVGSTPGLTRSMQEIQLDKNVRLLDCPGVIRLKDAENDASIALRNCKRIEKLEEPVGPVKEILERKLCPASTLVALYKIPSFDSVDAFLQNVATVRGKFKKGGVLDVEAAARIVLHDWNVGKIPYYTMPPSRNEGEPLEAKIVSVFEKEFNIDEAYNNESTYIGSLKSINGSHHVEVPPSCPVNIVENMHKGDVQPQPSSRCNLQANGTTDLFDPPPPDGGDLPMQCEAGYDAGNVEDRNDSSRQNNKLASQNGREKGEKLPEAGDAMVDDYDFKVDYRQRGSGMDDVREDGNDDGGVKDEMSVVPSNSVHETEIPGVED